MIFQGTHFDSLPELKTFKSIFLDLFRGEAEPSSVDLNGLEHVITFSNTGDQKVYMRVYKITLKKSGTTLPRVELEEMGPRFDFCLKRVREASFELWKQATKVPKELKPKKEKNIEHDAMGDQYGRIHLQKQDLNKMETRKMKGLKLAKKQKMRQEKEGVNQVNEKEEQSPSMSDGDMSE